MEHSFKTEKQDKALGPQFLNFFFPPKILFPILGRVCTQQQVSISLNHVPLSPIYCGPLHTCYTTTRREHWGAHSYLSQSTVQLFLCWWTETKVCLLKGHINIIRSTEERRGSHQVGHRKPK